MFQDPHHNQPVASTGASLNEAKAAAIFIHGRGASAKSILSFADEMAQPEITYLAPQAADYTWYPYSFLAPLTQNEPWLSSALKAVEAVMNQVVKGGIPPERTLLLGFSQGACLASEFAARHAQRYGGLVALSGGLIGNGERSNADPPADKRFDYDGHLESTPVFFGCSDVDPHIPVQRVHDSAEVLEQLGGNVTKRIYKGMGHTINEDEITHVRAMLNDLVSVTSDE